MRKLKLEALTVESFTTSPASKGTGTVRGHDALLELVTPTCPITRTAPSFVSIIEPPGFCCDC